jgi:hypothetical protein
MRGQKVFNELVKGKENIPGNKGRSNKLVTRRNDCLIARYYYFGAFRKLSYEDTIRELVAEFFLSPVTIANIIQNNTEQIQQLKEKALVLHYFQNHWPHLRW